MLLHTVVKLNSECYAHNDCQAFFKQHSNCLQHHQNVTSIDHMDSYLLDRQSPEKYLFRQAQISKKNFVFSFF